MEHIYYIFYGYFEQIKTIFHFMLGFKGVMFQIVISTLIIYVLMK